LKQRAKDQRLGEGEKAREERMFEEKIKKDPRLVGS